MADLNVYMNGYKVGIFTKVATGAHQFRYVDEWLNLPGSRPISLSMPLQHAVYKGEEVYNFFDNLLPDNPEIRNRILARYNADSTQPFDLLTRVGADTVGALQLLPQGSIPDDVHTTHYDVLTNAELEKILTGYQAGAPLGMIEEIADFRISLAGAQEKTALLWKEDRWCLPRGTTPTTHILKLPIGKIESHSHTIDLSESVENEWLCTLLAREFGLQVPDCFIVKVREIKALAVERFDRRYASDGRWIMRLPQEDFCQVLGIPSARKYESHGGPGIAQIMEHLLSSSNPEEDRYNFMKSQVLFWLLAATDGHAKNFSVFIEPEGRFRLTPFYDILSIYPALGGRGLHVRDAKLAMGLKGTRGKKDQIEQIFPRHFINTARDIGFEQQAMETILNEFADSVDSVIDRVCQQLPEDFPESIKEKILGGLKKRAARLHQE
ncbi:type II toxin-antitoxin system HipA family toxin [Pantoea cypripedii]|uniref:Serine/threonine protein kinase n=1 Tax=Pantoea cypripedii TaxID=55209 RepID=A0A1X1F0R6_PANCY|nr:type II toxin-antitoxin system HipA family toxin [Pantoea cypripedii]MBP2195789.1 serine/threonine-protein kinase HipA [Pantoea cypripedii]ORM95852.1 serine/threonine protein kinase [Pantoea cypripedii]